MKRHTLKFVGAILLAAVSTLSPAQQTKRAERDALLLFLQHLFQDAGPDSRITLATISLDGVEHKEILVYVTGKQFCGSGGCSLVVLEKRGEQIKVIGDVSISRPPIRALATSSFGHPDLGVLVSGGGILHAYEARLRFDSKRYPGNPSVFPAVRTRHAISGRTLITSADHGSLLRNQNDHDISQQDIKD